MGLRIEDYAIVGDLHTAALVGADGSIDWLCLPRFDSAACFANLLGDEQNGHWQLAPAGLAAGHVRAVRRRYRDSTLVLETEFETDDGVVRLVDAMPPRDKHADLIRIVECVSGEVPMMMRWALRFSYGSAVPWVRRITDSDGAEAITAIAGPDAIVLRGDRLPRPEQGRIHGMEWTMRAGDRASFAMDWFSSIDDIPAPYDRVAAVDRTEAWWREWASRCTYDGEYVDAVVRSLVTLRALAYDPTGGVVAAPTTSLPESFGGERNWDYRYCWLRDATLTLWSLIDAGYTREALAWRSWLLRAVAGDPVDMQIMYGLGGERQLPEFTLSWLSGYENSTPVRVGNAASEQLQLDVYGELMNALYQAREAGVEPDDFAWSLQRALLDFLREVWRQPDKGIWEMRGPARQFTQSKVMAWVAFDRGVKAVEHQGLEGPVEEWRRTRAEIRAEVLAEGWNEELGAFTQYYGGTEMDAALLTLPLYGFLPADDPRMLGTVAAIEKQLKHGDLVDRYRTSDQETHTVDGLAGQEGSFLACSFWLVENYARSGRKEDAEAMFERLIALRNDVGLLAEEYDGRKQRMAGNFPQAFSHVALVNAAMTLAGHGAPPHERSGPQLAGGDSS